MQKKKIFDYRPGCCRLCTVEKKIQSVLVLTLFSMITLSIISMGGFVTHRPLRRSKREYS